MEYLFPMALSILLESVKSAQKRATFKRQFAKLVWAIIVAYKSDREFLEMAGLAKEIPE